MSSKTATDSEIKIAYRNLLSSIILTVTLEIQKLKPNSKRRLKLMMFYMILRSDNNTTSSGLTFQAEALGRVHLVVLGASLWMIFSLCLAMYSVDIVVALVVSEE